MPVQSTNRSPVLVRRDGCHVVGHVAHAEFLDAVPAHEGAEPGRVQVIRVVRDRRPLGCGELLRRLAGLAQMRLEADVLAERDFRMPLPARDEVGIEVALRQHERVVVVVVVAAFAPAHELRALLERGVALADEVGFADAGAAQRVAHGRPRALAHADRRDLGRFDQRHLQAAAGGGVVLGREHGGGEPAGGTAAEDHHVPDRVSHDEGSVGSAGTGRPLRSRRTVRARRECVLA
jgi:hypothetical protein